MSKHWFRQWPGAVWQQAITWTNLDSDVCHNMALLGHNELMHFSIEQVHHFLLSLQPTFILPQYLGLESVLYAASRLCCKNSGWLANAAWQISCALFSCFSLALRPGINRPTWLAALLSRCMKVKVIAETCWPSEVFWRKKTNGVDGSNISQLSTTFRPQCVYSLSWIYQKIKHRYICIFYHFSTFRWPR